MNIAPVHTDLIEAPDLAITLGSGRATWDEKGNSIWEWQTAPGVFSREISAQQLRALEATELCLLDGTSMANETSLWSRSAKNNFSRRVKQATELVMPVRSERSTKASGFDAFLKRLGLPT